jgi:hypothetical protein
MSWTASLLITVGAAGGLAMEYAFTELEYTLDGPVGALLA